MSNFMNKPIIQSLTKYILLLFLLGAFFIFGLINRSFFGFNNIMTILRSASVATIMSMGMMLVVNTGEINFAIGAQTTLAATVIGTMLDSMTFHNYWLAVLCAFVAVELSVLIILVLVIRIRVPAFIATLGVSAVIDAFNRYKLGNTSLTSNFWPDIFTFIGRTSIAQIPLAFLIMAVLAAAIYIMMEKMVIGRSMYAVGANPTAANQVGISVKKIKVLAFILCGLLATIAGIIMVSLNNVVSYSAGETYLLPSMSAAILGATFLTPGKYNVPGTVIAAVFTVVVRVGVTSISAGAYATDIVQGVMLIISIALIANIRAEGLPSVSFG